MLTCDACGGLACDASGGLACDACGGLVPGREEVAMAGSEGWWLLLPTSLLLRVLRVLLACEPV